MAVYIIAHTVSGSPWKVGYSANVEKRVKQLQTASPHPIEVIHYWEDAGRMAEKYIHEKLKPYNLEGEWFSQNSVLSEMVTMGKSGYSWADVACWMDNNPSLFYGEMDRLDVVHKETILMTANMIQNFSIRQAERYLKKANGFSRKTAAAIVSVAKKMVPREAWA